MCGIFATTRPDLWRALVPEVLNRMVHRGPDANGVWESPSGRCLLIHTRLSIVGLGHEGDQPSVHERTALTYNGEIYNYRQLADADQLAGPLSDTQVIHRMIDRDGIASADKFRGMYAFAYWDEATGSLTVARDPWGIKPLYVLTHPSGGITVSSELPPLLLHSDGRSLDEAGVAQYVAFGHTGPERTFYANIEKLPPGTSLTVTGSRRSSRTIDQLSGYSALPLEQAIDNSIEAHFVADVEVGVFMSGGVDSTMVAVSASNRGTTLRTFTISFPDAPEIDESPLAEHNAKLLGTNHMTVPVTRPQMVQALDRFLTVHGEPFGDAAALPLTVLSEEAARHVKVVQTGEGADEMFGGYRRYDIMHQLRYRGLSTAGKLLSPLADRHYRYRSDSAKARSLEAALRGGGAAGLAALVDSDLPAIARSAPGGAARSQLHRDWAALSGQARGREAARRFDLARWLPNTYLEKADRATMASSLEGRTPFLDPVIAVAARAADRPFGKGDLRAILERRLPGVQLPTVKKGLATPIRLLLDAGLQSSLDRAVRSDSLLAGMLDRRQMDILVHRAQRSSATAYRLAVLGRWQDISGVV